MRKFNKENLAKRLSFSSKYLLSGYKQRISDLLCYHGNSKKSETCNGFQ